MKDSFTKIARGSSLAFFYGLILVLVGCASYPAEMREVKTRLRDGNPQAAAEVLKEKAFVDSDDQVVFLFEYGTAEQVSKDYKNSNRAFLLAEELTEIKDYHSLSRITGSLLLNEGMIQYKGEDYEKVLLNAMLAINFLMLGDLEAAMVETRRMNEKLYRYRFEAKKDYEQNPFAFYLAAMIREETKDWDGAYIDFKRVYDLNPNIPYLEEDLVRAASRARRTEDLKKWKTQFKVQENPAWNNKDYGELVLIYQQGWAPVKQPHPSWPRIPKLHPVPSTTNVAQIVVEDGEKETSQPVFSVEEVAIKTLDDLYAGLIAKRAAGIAAKAVVADQVRQKNQLLGDLAFIGMNLADRADLRQWSTLPESFQVAKLWLKKGKYKIKIQGLDSQGRLTSEYHEGIEVEVKPRKKTFLSWRSVK